MYSLLLGTYLLQSSLAIREKAECPVGSYGIHDNNFIDTDKEPIMSLMKNKQECQQICVDSDKCKAFIFQAKLNACKLFDSVSHLNYKKNGTESLSKLCGIPSFEGNGTVTGDLWRDINGNGDFHLYVTADNDEDGYPDFDFMDFIVNSTGDFYLKVYHIFNGEIFDNFYMENPGLNENIYDMPVMTALIEIVAASDVPSKTRRLLNQHIFRYHLEARDVDPTSAPTRDPTTDPTNDPTTDPTRDSTFDPTKDPTFVPTGNPTMNP